MISPDPPHPADQPWPRKATLLAASSLTVMSGATIAPSLPAVADHFAATPDVALLTRLVLTVPALFIAICAPLAGLIIDRFGRKRMILGATLVYVVAGTSGAMLDTLYGILIGRALLGVAVAGIMTTATTLAGDYFDGPARARFMGLQASSMAFGGVVFIAVGGLAADLHWRGPFFVYLAALALIPAMALTLYEPQRPRPTPAHTGSTTPVSAPWGLVALLFGTQIFTFVAFYMIPVQLPFYLRELGVAEPRLAGLAIASGALVAAITSIGYARIRARLSPPTIVALSFALMAAAYAAIASAETFPAVLAALVFAGMGMGAIMPNLSLWLMSSAPPALRGRLIGGMTASVFLGQFLSPLLVQPVAGPFGLATAYAATAGALLLVAAGFAVHTLRRRNGS
ncbi:MAG: MFS transporter [Inquilinus sp.]|nr:MFS transporter [Inquilinus sp.]